MLTETLGWYLEFPRHDPCWFIDLFLTGKVAVRDKARHDKIVKHFYFYLTCDVIGDPADNNVEFPSVNFPDEWNAS